MLINLIFYILQVVEGVRKIVLDQLFAGSRLASIIKYELEAVEEKLRKLTFVSLIVGTAFLFFGFKMLLRVFSNLVAKLSHKETKKREVHSSSTKEVSTEEVAKLANFKNYDGVDLDFKEEGQTYEDVIEKFKQLYLKLLI